VQERNNGIKPEIELRENIDLAFYMNDM